MTGSHYRHGIAKKKMVLRKYTHAHTHTHTYTRSVCGMLVPQEQVLAHKHIHTQTHTHTNTYTHKHIHTQTHTPNTYTHKHIHQACVWCARTTRASSRSKMASAKSGLRASSGSRALRHVSLSPKYVSLSLV
jgi:hypothetical protein